MFQASTPTHYFNCPDDPNEYEEILVSYEQYGQNLLNKKKSASELVIDAESKMFSITLTQEETNLFNPDQPAAVQVRIKMSDGQICVSPIYRLRIYGAINKEVL